jgi:proline-specific peptidase
MTMNKYSLEKSGTVAVDGGDIGYRYYEPHNPKYKNRAPVVLVHGGPGGCHMGMFDALSALAETRPVIGYDQLGSHLSPAKIDNDLMKVERFTEEPRYLLDALGIEKAVLLGHSWGGVIISEFALKYPNRVAGLIYSSPLISTQRWVDDCNALLAQLPPEMQKTIRECEANNTTDSQAYKGADSYFGKRHFSRAAKPASLVGANGKRSNRELYNSMWGPSEFTHSGTLGQLDLFPRLKELTAPTLIVCGEYDTATPTYMQEVQGEINGARLSVIKDAGHAVYTDGNKAYLQAVRSYLKDRVDCKARPSVKVNSPKP